MYLYTKPSCGKTCVQLKRMQNGITMSYIGIHHRPNLIHIHPSSTRVGEWYKTNPVRQLAYRVKRFLENSLFSAYTWNFDALFVDFIC